MRRERLDVFWALAQWSNQDRKHLQAEVEILSEPACLRFGPEVMLNIAALVITPP